MPLVYNNADTELGRVVAYSFFLLNICITLVVLVNIAINGTLQMFNIVFFCLDIFSHTAFSSLE